MLCSRDVDVLHQQDLFLTVVINQARLQNPTGIRGLIQQKKKPKENKQWTLGIPDFGDFC